jgi:predicted nuclease with TOPRIM domain
LEEDFIAALEQRVDSLVDGYVQLKNEKESIVSEIDDKNNRIQELEGENSKLAKELYSLKDISAGQRNKLGTAARKVSELIAKLEAVE